MFSRWWFKKNLLQCRNVMTASLPSLQKFPMSFSWEGSLRKAFMRVSLGTDIFNVGALESVNSTRNNSFSQSCPNFRRREAHQTLHTSLMEKSQILSSFVSSFFNFVLAFLGFLLSIREQSPSKVLLKYAPDPEWKDKVAPKNPSFTLARYLCSELVV